MAIDVGEGARISTDPPFTDFAGAPADPTTVRLRYRREGGLSTVLTYGVDVSVVRDGVGTYHAVIVPTSPGTYFARWEGEGNIVAAEEISFTVGGTFGEIETTLPDEITDGGQSYLTTDRLRTIPLGIKWTGYSDFDLADYIDQAAAIADAYCLVPLNAGANAFLGKTVTESHRWRYPMNFADTGQRRLYPLNWPVISIQSLSIVVGHGAAAAIPPSSLVIDNDHRWIEVTSLAIASGSGLFSVEGWIVPIGGLSQPKAELTYTYGRAIPEVDELAQAIDGGRRVFQTRHGCWTAADVEVKEDAEVVDPDDYSLDRATGRVIFLTARNRVTVTYAHRLPRDIPLGVAYIVASLIGEVRTRQRGLTGLASLRVNEISMVKEKVDVSADNLDQTVPRAAALLNGYRHWRIGTA